MTNTENWTNYRETVYGKDAKTWIRLNIIEAAQERFGDPSVAPWDDWRIVERNGGLQAQIKRHV